MPKLYESRWKNTKYSYRNINKATLCCVMVSLYNTVKLYYMYKLHSIPVSSSSYRNRKYSIVGLIWSYVALTLIIACIQYFDYLNSK